ncbi:hypothetical protein SEVIR_5G174700v4 [Setaria viridis]|uniref:Uncharacterized protein n=2 Tax=Setaria TaxID=4554 RepID=K3XN97_SETIT|nr:hypothetical protein SETIT_5G174800v2 [Setaria italica]TKW14533.1 hypothetical protein SEVIR_5G174700v2 [Setaria viridis]
MDCASNRSSEPSPAPAATWAFLLQEATGDSECDDDLQQAALDADDGDAESCSGGEDCSADLDERRLVSWECWMMESASVVAVGGEVACPASTEEGTAAGAGDADSDRLFWEACIAHGY